jgi:two-component system nitrate/nitrite sensor histidine kinase NarX
MDYLNPHPSDIPTEFALKLGFKGAISVPLMSAGEALGMYNLSYQRSREWTSGDLQYLCAIGRILGIIIQRAQMSRKFTEMLILNERKFLSSEIHDNLAQSISSLKLGVETASMLLEDGKLEDLHATLERSKSIGQQAVSQLRGEMLDLRTPVSAYAGLTGSIEEVLHDFQERWLIKTQLSVVGNSQPSVTGQSELQILRILHESLSNVLRHAYASHVEVRLMQDGRWLIMRVIDDGRGFDTAAVSAERLGLAIMKERAEQMGGSCTVESTLGRGTTVRLRMPSII